MIVDYRPGAEGSIPTEGVALVRLTDSQRAWLIHCVKSTPGTRADEDIATSCVVALGGQF